MKKNIISSLLLLGAFAASATQLTVAPRNFQPDAPLKPVVSKSANIKSLKPATNQIITTAPNGTYMSEVVWSSRSCYVQNNMMRWREVTGFVPTIVTTGNEMYIYAPITSLTEIAAAWIKGEIAADGKSVVFHTPQAYMINEATPGVVSTLYATRVDATNGKPEEGNLDLVFSYIDGELVQTDGGLLALTDLDGGWYGYGEMDIQVTKIKESVVTLPSDANLASYIMTYTKNGAEMRQSAVIGTKDNDVYFSDPLGIENSWFMGTKTDNKIVVKTPQYIGAGSGYPLYVVTGKEFTRYETEPITGQQYEVTDYEVTPGADIIFTYNPENGYYESTQVLLLSSNKEERGDASAPFMAPLYEPWEAKPVTPATPTVSYYLDLKDYEMYGLYGCMLAVEVPYESVDGDFLPQEKLYYQIEFDQNPLEFFGVSMIPFYGQFQDAATQSSITISDTTHQIQLLQKPQNSISIQSFYDFEGNMLPSEKLTYAVVNGELLPAGIDAVEMSEVKDVIYYDMTGRRVSASTNGILIKQEVLGNGTVRTEKILNKTN